MNNFTQKANLIWEIADLLRGDYKPREYVDVILPLTVLYRLDLAIAGARDAVRQAYAQYHGRLDNLHDLLTSRAGGLVYNTSRFDWPTLLQAPDDIAQNLIHYLNGYSPEVQDVIEKFDFRRQVSRLQASRLIYPVMQAFLKVDLHPDRVSNLEMGTIFEELIRRFSEQYNETAGEHFTPREIIRLMVELIFSEDDDVLHVPGKIRTVYDPACGTGGMLTEAKNYILERNPNANVVLFGQELNPNAYAVAKSDILLKGEEPDNIVYGNSFSEDGHHRRRFNIMLSNPPFGVSWKKVEWVIKQEQEKLGYDGRFGAGTPRINDGALLFLQHMLSKMDAAEGSRIAIIFNGSPLFTGDAGSGESEVRRWIIENDWLEGIIALPDQLFYNTGINTYIWVLTNRKSDRRKGAVQLVNGVSFYEKMRKSLGSKRHQISPDHIAELAALYRGFADGQHVRVYPNHFFGYRKVRIERPLRLSFAVTPERIARLDEQSAFQSLAQSRKKDTAARAADETAGRAQQDALRCLVADLPQTTYSDRALLMRDLKKLAKQRGVRLTKSLATAIVSALGEQDPEAAVCYIDDNKKKGPEADSNLRDYETVPLDETVDAYFEREVLPHVPDAYIDTAWTDDKDGQVGRVGYEISFTRYFYTYEPPRPLEVIESEIKALESEIVELLTQVTLVVG